MRFRLMTATALAPFCVLGLNGLAWAQTDTISNGASAAQQTATAVNGGPGDIDVSANGSLNPGGGTAITLNSNNNVSIEGSVSITGANNAIGVLATDAWTGSISTTGSISIGENYTAPSSDTDGYTEEPFASGTGRYGIETLGNLNGSVNANGSIAVQGNNSYAIAIQNGLTGSLNVGQEAVAVSTITVTGDHSVGVFAQGPIGGAVQIGSSVTATGQGSNAVQLMSNIGGSLTVYSTLTATGYASTSRPTTQALLNLVQATPSQIEQGGSALIIGGSVGGGIFLGAQPAGTTASTTADLDGDGIADGVEGTTAITVYGSSPALVIGGNTSPINIGNFGSCNASGYGLLDNCFGLILEGTVTADGVYDGVNATAIDIGVGGAGVNFLTNADGTGGGLRIASGATVSATAYSGNATAIQIESGVTMPLLQNEGIITSTVTSSNPNASTGILINPGANVKALTNFGTITATVTGDTGSSYAVVDKSGSITQFTNNGVLSATLTAANAGEATTGKTVALDLSANTTGVAFTQQLSSQTDSPPTTIGDVLLSSTGTNNLQLLYGEIAGTVNLGSGANSILNLDNGGTIVGNLIYTGNSISISVPSGDLNNEYPSIITGKSLTVGAGSTLGFALDPLKSAGVASNTEYNVTTANIAGGATVSVRFLSAPSTTQSFTLVQTSANGLTVGSTNLSAAAPFLFNTNLQANTATGALTVTVSPKTAAQLGLNKAETAALPAIYASLSQDSGILNALANASTSANFHAAYQQMLPDSSGDVFQVITSMDKAVTRAATGSAGFNDAGSSTTHLSADDADNEEDDIGTPGGLWASEYIVGMNQQRQDNEAYSAVGLGLVGGIDFGGFGADVSFASANVVKPHDPGDSIVSINHLQLGLYAAPQFGILHTEAAFSGGYMRVSERREFAATVLSGDESTSTAVSRTANGVWNGYDFSGHVGASAPFDVTQHIFLMPEAHLDFFDVSEAAYNETGGGLGFDMDVNSRASSEGSMTAGLVAGAHFGSTFIFKPQFELGYDDVVTGGPASTTARFSYGGASFVLPADSVQGGAAVARIRLQGDGAFVHFDLEGGGEFRNDYQNADVRAVFRISY